MNKNELIEKIQDSLGDASKNQAKEALNTVLDCIKAGVVKDGSVQLIGFGTFKVSERKAREGRNPQTGDKIMIKASKSVRFSPSSNFKDSL